MTPSLEIKLAAVMRYLEDRRAGRVNPDPKAFDNYLDDPEICRWLDRMNHSGRIGTTRFQSL